MNTPDTPYFVPPEIKRAIIWKVVRAPGLQSAVITFFFLCCILTWAMIKQQNYAVAGLVLFLSLCLLDAGWFEITRWKMYYDHYIARFQMMVHGMVWHYMDPDVIKGTNNVDPEYKNQVVYKTVKVFHGFEKFPKRGYKFVLYFDTKEDRLYIWSYIAYVAITEAKDRTFYGELIRKIAFDKSVAQ